MTKAELVEQIVRTNSDFSKATAETALTAVLGAIQSSLASGEEKIRINGFGTFEVRLRSARNCINPKTREPITVPAHKVVAFKAAKALSGSVQ
ncbi:MAG: HU family DNA-binding protein [Planctomycetota bacterium]|nr:HU family DNA-binding protein [Planctomycetota bacterium]